MQLLQTRFPIFTVCRDLRMIARHRSRHTSKERNIASLRPLLILTALGTTIFTVNGLYRWWTSDDDSRAESRQRLADASPPDVVPSSRIVFAGDVLVAGILGQTERQDADQPSGETTWRQGCEALCAVLATPGVKSVTVAPVSSELTDLDSATRFRLVPRASCKTATVMPQELSRLSPKTHRQPIAGGAGDPVDTTIEMAWSRRLSTTDCIVADAPRRHHDMAITYFWFDRFGPPINVEDWRWTRDPLTVDGQRLTITGRGGRTLFRKTSASTMMIGRPRMFGLHLVGYGVLPGWRRVRLSNTPSTEPLNRYDLILANSTLDPGVVRTSRMDRR